MTVSEQRGRHRPSRVDGYSRVSMLVSPSGTWRAVPGPKHRVASGSLLAALHDMTLRLPVQRRRP